MLDNKEFSKYTADIYQSSLTLFSLLQTTITADYKITRLRYFNFSPETLY